MSRKIELTLGWGVVFLAQTMYLDLSEGKGLNDLRVSRTTGVFYATGEVMLPAPFFFCYNFTILIKIKTLPRWKTGQQDLIFLGI